MLVVDIGNTFIKLGYFKDTELASQFKIKTEIDKDINYYKNALNNFLQECDFEKVSIASVVPKLNDIFKDLFKNKGANFVDHNSPISFKIKRIDPPAIGADLLTTTEATVKKYGYPIIIVTTGTATTFLVVNNNKELIGGAISPGLDLSYNALINNASKLKDSGLDFPETSIGNTTKKALESGVILGHASMIDGMIEKIKRDLNLAKVKVIGTGGAIKSVKSAIKNIDTYDENLSLEGIYLIAKNNEE